MNTVEGNHGGNSESNDILVLKKKKLDIPLCGTFLGFEFDDDANGVIIFIILQCLQAMLWYRRNMAR